MTEEASVSEIESQLAAHRNSYETAVSERLAAPLNRPNGSALLIGGTCALVLGLVLMVIGLIMPTLSDPGREAIGDLISAVPPTFNPYKWPFIYMGSSLCSISVLVLSLGAVVRAMFFLPGREVPTREIHPNG